MRGKIRRFIRKRVRRTGFRRQIAPTFVEVMNVHSIEIVLDVGANDGDFGREIRDEGYRGRIISFEPNPEAYERLVTNIAGDPLWEAFQLGVGDAAGTLKLSVSNADVFSSFKTITELGNIAHHAQEARTVDVEVVRLDQFLSKHPDFVGKTYLKIDTQGFEMEVLRGTGGYLAQVSAVQAELGLVKTYQNEADWIDVVLWMRSQGFEVATASCNSVISHAAQAREFDFVFVQRPRDRLAAVHS